MTPYEFYRFIEEKQIVLAFQGMMTNEVLTIIGNNLKKKQADEVQSKRVFSVVVELAQNINLYSAEKEYSETDKRQVGTGIIVVSEHTGHHLVTSGNFVKRSEAARLDQLCAHINSLSEQELKGYFKAQRRLPDEQDAVGLTEMVRRSGNPLQHELLDAAPETENLFFILTVKVNK